MTWLHRIVVVCMALACSRLHGQLVLVEEGGEFAPDNLATSLDALPFASDTLVGFENIHNALHLNDGIYGNSNSWIGEATLPGFAGVNLGDSVTVASIAWGRDNGGEDQMFTDRSLGTYLVQYTTVDNPDETTPDEEWTEIGSVTYDNTCPVTPSVRHRYNFDPITDVTGIRIVVPGVGLGGGTCIDEIEVYEDPGAGADPCSGGLEPLVLREEGGTFAAGNLATAAGAAAFASDALSAEFCFEDVFEFLTPVEEGGTFDDGNLATMAGTVPFAIDSLEGFPIHDIANLNDGIYGNSNSWIGNSGEPAFCGLRFDGAVTVRGIAFGRDNGGEAPEPEFTDRSEGTYRLQYTDVADPDENTPDEDWFDLAEFTYGAGCPARSWLRHRYNFDDEIELTGIRLVVPGAGIGGGTCIDELEVYGETAPPVAGTLHPASNVNDGEYGNDSTWIPGDAVPAFVGVALAGRTAVSSVAFGRDNGGEAEEFSDRTLGSFIVETTNVDAPGAATPDTDWTTVGFVRYEAGAFCPPEPSLRHRLDFDARQATAVRVRVPAGAAIDELEVYAAAAGGADICSDITVPCSGPEQSLTLAQTGGFFDGANLALGDGVVPFASGDLGPELGIDFHVTANVNDGIYGNMNSWIGSGAAPGFCGVSFPQLTTVGSIAWGRDNGGEAQEFVDRNLGSYCVEYTTVPSPDASTPDSDWTTLATVDYFENDPPLTHRRHRWDFDAQVQATGIRLVVPGVGLGGGTAIDELEVYEEPCGEDCETLTLCPEEGEDLENVETGGPFTTPALPFDVPPFDEGNLALAADAVPFATPTFDDVPAHMIAHLNDGFYGNDNSWLGIAAGETSGEVYAGVYFEGGARTVEGIAIGRDNTGTFADRVLGCYTVQVTADAFDPADDADVAGASWTTVGLGAEHLTDGLPVNLRRRYVFPAPVAARAVRVIVAAQAAIDEIEVYGEGGPPPRREFIRGNVDADGGINITDGVFLFNFLFLGGNVPTCLEAADANNDGELNITDGIVILNFQFLGGVEPSPPGPRTCGPDPDAPGSANDIGCNSFPCP